jgi:hypothetical protein
MILTGMNLGNKYTPMHQFALGYMIVFRRFAGLDLNLLEPAVVRVQVYMTESACLQWSPG